MASRARGELAKELAAFWRDRVRTNGDIPWACSRIAEFAKFLVQLRVVLLNDGSSELTTAELNTAISRLLPRFTDFMAVCDDVQEVLEVESMKGILTHPSRLTPGILRDEPLVRTPRDATGDYTRGDGPARWER